MTKESKQRNKVVVTPDEKSEDFFVDQFAELLLKQLESAKR